MINETLEADRAYQRDKDDAYNRGYAQGYKDAKAEQTGHIKGRWIEIALNNHTYKCSVCGRLLVNITDGKNNVAKNYPYCHCGAEMGEVTT